jgi:hypothetical protein
MSKAIDLYSRRLAELESSTEGNAEQLKERIQRRQVGHYRTMADLCADVGQGEKGLTYLGMAEQALAESGGEIDLEQLPSLAKTRARLYEGMDDNGKALESYLQAYAFRMDRDTWEEIDSLANKGGKSLDTLMAKARDLRLARAYPFPSFELKTLSGETKTFDDVRGRVTLVNFFFPT